MGLEPPLRAPRPGRDEARRPHRAVEEARIFAGGMLFWRARANVKGLAGVAGAETGSVSCFLNVSWRQPLTFTSTSTWVTVDASSRSNGEGVYLHLQAPPLPGEDRMSPLSCSAPHDRALPVRLRYRYLDERRREGGPRQRALCGYARRRLAPPRVAGGTFAGPSRCVAYAGDGLTARSRAFSAGQNNGSSTYTGKWWRARRR
jgi:hypothetical protein